MSVRTVRSLTRGNASSSLRASSRVNGTVPPGCPGSQIGTLSLAENEIYGLRISNRFNIRMFAHVSSLLIYIYIYILLNPGRHGGIPLKTSHSVVP